MEVVPHHISVVSDKHEYNRQISIWLDDYEDIFSDFDPRPYDDRSLSDDFISEVKKVSHEDGFGVAEMNLLVPEKSRKADVENVIIKRLHAFFKKNNYYIIKRTRFNRVKGVTMMLAGMLMLLVATYITGQQQTYLTNFSRVAMEPAGWFFAWRGMDTLFFLSVKLKEEHDFYTKMAKTKVNFKSF